jgi:hypothetical protein
VFGSTGRASLRRREATASAFTELDVSDGRDDNIALMQCGRNVDICSIGAPKLALATAVELAALQRLNGSCTSEDANCDESEGEFHDVGFETMMETA